jgi:hypothetical protein
MLGPVFGSTPILTSPHMTLTVGIVMEGWSSLSNNVCVFLLFRESFKRCFMAVHACNPRIWEDHEFKVRLGSIVITLSPKGKKWFLFLLLREGYPSCFSDTLFFFFP